MFETIYVAPVTAVFAAGLWASNVAYDRGMQHYLSRKIGHFAGGVAFILGVVLFSSAVWPMILSAIFTALFYGARKFKPSTFRGVGGSGRQDKFSEVWFTFMPLVVFGIAWLWLDLPMVALAALLFMAWGDGITGVVRAKVYRKASKGLWGSAAMFAVSLAVALVLIRPAWIGLAGALTATLSEWSFGDYSVLKKGDDNWAVPLSSLAVMLFLLMISGNL